MILFACRRRNVNNLICVLKFWSSFKQVWYVSSLFWASVSGIIDMSCCGVTVYTQVLSNHVIMKVTEFILGLYSVGITR
jgi:hypothetical protein